MGQGQGSKQASVCLSQNRPTLFTAEYRRRRLNQPNQGLDVALDFSVSVKSDVFVLFFGFLLHALFSSLSLSVPEQLTAWEDSSAKLPYSYFVEWNVNL